MSDKTAVLPSIEDIMQDFSTSFWLRQAIESALLRDPVDAARDAELLSFLLGRRCDETLKSHLVGR